jgi:hypothetical protein
MFISLITPSFVNFVGTIIGLIINSLIWFIFAFNFVMYVKDSFFNKDKKNNDNKHA